MGHTVRYIISDIAALNAYPDENVVMLDWRGDFDCINQYYREGFQIDDLRRDDPDNDAIAGVAAYVLDGKMRSMAAIMRIRENELEIGAVSTLPGERNRGYGKKVIYYAARSILTEGILAVLTTKDDNAAMRRAAESIGMKLDPSRAV